MANLLQNIAIAKFSIGNWIVLKIGFPTQMEKFSFGT